MISVIQRQGAMFLALAASLVMAFATGCASGGYSLTRQYARWVNSQNVFIRIILYLLTGIVFAITMLIDLVVFNTMDFWQGKVSQGIYEFKDQGKTYVADHRISPETGRKQSLIRVFDENQKLLQEVALMETPEGEIEMKVDGVRRALVKDVSVLPVAQIFDGKGQFMSEKALWSELNPEAARYSAQR